MSTTPIPDVPIEAQGFCKPFITGAAFNGCVDEYNAAALELLHDKPDVHVADLNAAVLDVCGKGYSACNLQRWQNVHFTDAGKQARTAAHLSCVLRCSSLSRASFRSSAR